MKMSFRLAQHAIWIATILIGLSESVVAQKNQTLDDLKSAYVINLTKFIYWPEKSFSSSQSPINFCLFGDGEVVEVLETISGTKLDSHPIAIKHPVVKSDFQSCHVLYISSSERRRYRYILSLINIFEVVTISDDERFIQSGGLINLAERNQRLRFEVNQVLLKKHHATLSSKLLRLAILLSGPEVIQ